MSELPRPIRSVLRDPTDEGTADRVLRGLGRPRRRAPGWTLALVGATCALLAAVLLRREAGPLLLPDGTPLAALAAGNGAATRLSDGSTLRLRDGARLRTTRNDGRRYAAVVRGGTAGVTIPPGAARWWSLDCGEVVVEGAGADFVVAHTPAGVEVTVRRGEVRLRGSSRPLAPRVLRAGESFALGPPPPSVPPVEAVRAGPAPSVVPAPPAPSAATVAPRPSAPSWRSLAAAGRWRDAYDTLGRSRLVVAARSPAMTADDLLAMADVARLSGHPAEAVAPLEAVIASHAREPAAALAAITLGRLDLDALDRPAAAAVALRRALALGVPSSLEEDARVRLVEAYVRAGDAEGADAAAVAYRARFRSGRRAAEVARLLARSAE